MTVAELIAKLETLPQDMDVYFKTLPVNYIDQPVSNAAVAPADYGQLILIS